MNALDSEGSQSYTENQNSKIIFDRVIRVHRVLDPDLLESSMKNGISRVINNL